MQNEAIGPLALFLIGLSGSLHCAGMCGPLACVALPGQRNHCAEPGRPSRTLRALLTFHGARLFGYSALGALLGAAGQALLAPLRGPVQATVPWLTAALLLASGLGLGGRLGRLVPPVPVERLVSGLRSRPGGPAASETARAALLGAIVGLLPCGLLYGAFLVAAAAGDAASGGVAMAAFGLGAIPALVAAQASTRWLSLRSAPLAVWIHRAALFCAAGVLIYRALAPHLAPHSCH